MILIVLVFLLFFSNSFIIIPFQFSNLIFVLPGKVSRVRSERNRLYPPYRIFFFPSFILERLHHILQMLTVFKPNNDFVRILWQQELVSLREKPSEHVKHSRFPLEDVCRYLVKDKVWVAVLQRRWY